MSRTLNKNTIDFDYRQLCSIKKFINMISVCNQGKCSYNLTADVKYVIITVTPLFPTSVMVLRRNFGDARSEEP